MLNNIKTKQRGFTLVELLIVIVIIAILATITIVAYNGIQTRANNTAAATTAETVDKKMEGYNAIQGNYVPYGTSITTSLNSLSDSSLTGTNITLSTTTPTGAARINTVYIQWCGATGAPSATIPVVGYRVFRYDFSTNAWQTTPDQTGGNVIAANCANATQ